MADLDLVNRDPNNINDHLKVAFEDVLAEPEGVRSMDCVWTNSYKCFNCCKDICYMISTLFCGICIAMEWGCEFADIAFVHIWYVTPCFKVMELNCGCIQKLYGMCVHCCMDPCCEACGILFSAFKK
ncbi:caveolin-1-like [Babylonia areolata]|uniref:caveolin-1-like n=1 Tax=Babylonia areolata TaxID=304850 RepID=UPI003FD2F643